MNGEGIRRRGMRGKRRVSSDLLYFRNQLEARNGQDRRVQNLANGAGSFGSLMLVKECRARGDVQQHQAAQDG